MSTIYAIAQPQGKHNIFWHSQTTKFQTATCKIIKAKRVQHTAEF